MSTRVLKFPPDLDDDVSFPAIMEFKFYDRVSIKEKRLRETIYLYMPEKAVVPSTVNWDNKELGYTLGKYFSGGSQSAFSFDALTQTGTKFKDHLIHKTQSIGTNMLGGNVTTEDMMGVRQGKIPNAYITTLFRGVDLRSFSYVFTFSPRNERDCYIIDDITRLFRYHSLPSKTDEGGTFLGYPSEVDITYKWKGEDNQWLNSIKRCVITAIDTDYTPESIFTTKRNGFPSSIQLSLTFTELEITTREDVMENAKGRY